jgi:hypothetical protein
MEGQPARPPFNIPSPVELTESDEEAPHSAQDPNVPAEKGGNSEHVGNSDNREGATISGSPAVHAEIVQRQQTTVRDESEALYSAHLAEMAEEDADDVDQDIESETERGARKRRRNRCGVRRARIAWKTIEVIDRSQLSDAEIQNRLNEIATTIYEKAGTAYPPGLLYLFLISANIRISLRYSFSLLSICPF